NCRQVRNGTVRRRWLADELLPPLLQFLGGELGRSRSDLRGERSRLPDQHGTVTAAGEQGFAVPAKGNTGDIADVASQGTHFLARRLAKHCLPWILADALPQVLGACKVTQENALLMPVAKALGLTVPMREDQTVRGEGHLARWDTQPPHLEHLFARGDFPD